MQFKSEMQQQINKVIDENEGVKTMRADLLLLRSETSHLRPDFELIKIVSIENTRRLERIEARLETQSIDIEECCDLAEAHLMKFESVSARLKTQDEKIDGLAHQMGLFQTKVDAEFRRLNERTDKLEARMNKLDAKLDRVLELLEKNDKKI